MGFRTPVRRTRIPASRNELLHTALGVWALGTLGVLLALSAFAAEPAPGASPAPPGGAPTGRFERETEKTFTDLKSIIEDPSFDRLDGKGKSRKKVDVIEWEGNLELHVYPARSLKGLALKIDERNEKRKVLVIGYRFENAPRKQLIRRALLGVSLTPGFHAYRDPSGGTEYDKIVISQSTLPKPLEELRLDPEPDRLYPDGHPLNERNDESKTPPPPPKPQPFSDVRPTERTPARTRSLVSEDDSAAGTVDEDTGSIRPFRW
jgi:hypothetical protein